MACDMFQVVELRDLQWIGEDQQDRVLELSASFLDERPDKRTHR